MQWTGYLPNPGKFEGERPYVAHFFVEEVQTADARAMMRDMRKHNADY